MVPQPSPLSSQLLDMDNRVRDLKCKGNIRPTERLICINTLFFFFPFDLVFLQLLGKLLFLLLVHVAMQMFGGVAESWRHEDLSVLTQLIPDADQEVLQLHGIFKDLRICPAESNKTFLFISEPAGKHSA